MCQLGGEGRVITSCRGRQGGRRAIDPGVATNHGMTYCSVLSAKRPVLMRCTRETGVLHVVIFVGGTWQLIFLDGMMNNWDEHLINY